MHVEVDSKPVEIHSEFETDDASMAKLLDSVARVEAAKQTELQLAGGNRDALSKVFDMSANDRAKFIQGVQTEFDHQADAAEQTGNTPPAFGLLADSLARVSPKKPEVNVAAIR